jgi:hypothetical protein
VVNYAASSPLAKPGQAKPSSAKQIQAKLLGFAWFYSSESGLINGLHRFQIKIFLLVVRLVGRRAASPGAPAFSDYNNKIDRYPDFRKRQATKF